MAVLPEHRGGRYFSLSVLGGTTFLGGCTLSILAPFYSKEAESHGLSVTASGSVFAAVFLVQVICSPFLGKHIQRLGSTRMFVLGSLLSGLTNLVFGFLPLIQSGELFLLTCLAVRSLTAVGEAAMSVSVYPLARGRCSSTAQSRVVSSLETMFGAGTTLGPFLGGLLYYAGGFPLPFATCGCLLLGCSALARCALATDLPPEPGETRGEEEAGHPTSYRGEIQHEIQSTQRHN